MGPIILFCLTLPQVAFPGQEPYSTTKKDRNMSILAKPLQEFYKMQGSGNEK